MIDDETGDAGNEYRGKRNRASWKDYAPRGIVLARREALVPWGELLQANGLKLSGGTIVDATIIAAPSSTRNKGRARDPEMHLRRYTQRGVRGQPELARLAWRSRNPIARQVS